MEADGEQMKQIDGTMYVLTSGVNDYNDPDGNDVVANETDQVAEKDEYPRQKWGKKADFLLSVIGFAVDLANVWRFPYLCYKNGGGAFLIPYVLMLAFGGIPLFFMELSLGQYHRKGAITCWRRLCPLFRGIGYAVVIIAFYVDFFYNVVIAWALYYFFASWTLNLPWVGCDNPWNTDDCFDGDVTAINHTTDNMTDSVELYNFTLNFTLNETRKRVSPSQEYFNFQVLELDKADGISRLGHIKWELALCLLAVYIICYFSLWKGISTSGKVVWFTAIFPYVVLMCLLIRGVTLPGSVKGIEYYLTPNFTKLGEPEVWVDAATQIFFSLGPGFGVLMAFASYNEFHNNVYHDAILTSCINCLTSFLSGFVIFAVLGYMSHRSGVSIKDVATEGPGLVFIVYPEAIATMPGSTAWAILFFLMLLTLGLDSSFGGSEAIITALSDEFVWVKKHREIFIGCLFTLYYCIGLTACAQGGNYFVTLLDRMAAGYSILIAVFFEAVVVSWLYGVDRMSSDICEMIGTRPSAYWRTCWKFIAPPFILFIVTFGLAFHEPLKYDDYVYPTWANALGWIIAMSSVFMIPAMALYTLATTPGDTFLERLRTSITPLADQEAAARAVKNDQTEVRVSGGAMGAAV